MSFIKKFIGVVLLMVTELFIKINAQTAGCGGTFTSLSGTISSPNYPSDYSNNLNCIYNIQASPPNSVNITFIAFDTEVCCDYLQISCSTDSTKASPKFYGSSLPPFLSIGSCTNVRIQFYTDGSVVAKGFSLSYTIGSGMTGGLTIRPMNNYVPSYSTETTVLGCSSRANQPDVYPWWSYSSDGSSFKIITDSTCSVLSSYTGNRNTIREYSTRTCNLTISQAYLTSVSGIYSCTDSTLDFANAIVTSIGCGGTFASLSGTISSPNYPSDYSNNLNCTYNIQASPSNSVNITFLSFDTEVCCDYLQISCSTDSTKASPKFYGSSLPPFLSIGSCTNVRIQFYTDFSAVAKGFSLRYTIGSGMTGGLTMRPMNNFVINYSAETISLGCSSRANQPNVYPWWSYSYDGSAFRVITDSTCSVLSSYTGYRNTTREYSARTCNLTISQAYLTSVYGVYTCIDSTLDFANAIVTSIVPSFSTFPDLRSATTEVVLGDQFSITCSVRVDQAFNSPLQMKPSLYLYENNRLAATYNTTINDTITAVQPLLPSYECVINFTFSGYFPTGYATNVAQNISITTPSRLVLYWPKNEDMLITGDDSGRVVANESLSCFVPANPSANYQWRDEQLGHQWEGPNTIVSHNGTYTCTATNRIRGITYNASKAIYVTIIDHPNIDTEKPGSENQLNIVALIVGVVLGATVLLLLITVIATCVCLHRKKDSAKDSNPENIAAEANTRESPRKDDLYELNHRDTMYESGTGDTNVSTNDYEAISRETNAYDYEKLKTANEKK